MMAKENSKKKTSKNDKNTSSKKAVSEQNKESAKNSASIKDNIHFWRILSVVSIVLLCVSICGNLFALSSLGVFAHSSPFEVTYNGCGYENPEEYYTNCIYVDLTFENNSGMDAPFIACCTSQAFQNGIMLRDVSGGWHREYMDTVQTGCSIQIRQYYQLRDDSPVFLKVTDKPDGNVPLEQTIDLPN